MTFLGQLLIVSFTISAVWGCSVYRSTAYCNVTSWEEAYDSLHKQTRLEQLSFVNVTGSKNWPQFTFPAVNFVNIHDSDVSLDILKDIIKISQLSTLYIVDSKVECWTDDKTFDGDQLERLTVFNSLKCLQPPPFSFPRLHELDISKNSLKEVPAIVSPALFYLNLSKNNISVVINFDSFPRLTELILSDNPISVIPNDAFSGNPELTRLSLSNTLLKTMTFSAPALQILSVKNCKLETLSESFFDGLSQLKALELSNNLITDITTQFDNLKRLNQLDLSGNQMLNIANDALDSLQALEVLKLNSSALLKLPRISHYLSNLHYVDVSHNALKSLNFDFFSKFPNLATLLANDNSLTHIDSHSLGSVRRMNISRNNLYFNGDNTLKGMVNLHDLEIANNWLEGDITSTILNSLPSLQKLNVENNQITEIGKWEGHPFLMSLKIRNNPLTCGRKLQKELQSVLIAIQDFDYPEDVVTFNTSISLHPWQRAYISVCTQEEHEISHLQEQLEKEDSYGSEQLTDHYDEKSENSHNFEHDLGEAAGIMDGAKSEEVDDQMNMPEEQLPKLLIPISSINLLPTPANENELDEPGYSDSEYFVVYSSFNWAILLFIVFGILLVILIITVVGFICVRRKKQIILPSSHPSSYEKLGSGVYNETTTRQPKTNFTSNLGSVLANNPISGAFKSENLGVVFGKLRLKFEGQDDELETRMIPAESSQSIA